MMWTADQMAAALQEAQAAVLAGNVPLARLRYAQLYQHSTGLGQVVAVTKLGDLAGHDRNWTRALAYYRLAAAAIGQAAKQARVSPRELPWLSDLYANYGKAALALQLHDEARVALEQGLVFGRAPVTTHLALADLAARQGDADTARRHTDAALAVVPPADRWDERRNQAQARLARGQWKRGFRQAEARHDAPLYAATYGVHLPTPRARKLRDCRGKAVLCYHEQGIGDSVQMTRFLPTLAAVASAVTLVLPRALAPLYDGGPYTVLPTDAVPDAPPHEVHVALFSLPALCLATDVIPAPWTPPAWPTWQGPTGRRRIGLAWKGDPRHANDRYRSIHASDLLRPLLAIPGVTWVRIQQGHPHDLADVPMETPTGETWADTAVTLAGLDALVTVDTGVAHVAGTVGVPTHLLLPRPAEWRWEADRDRTPWYPSMTLWRQTRPNDWSGPVAALTAHLTANG